MLSRHNRGVTLIELMIGMTIISCLLLVGMPSFTNWIKDLQIRSAAEAIQSGLLLAQRSDKAQPPGADDAGGRRRPG
jgi:type IV fimbrial biogenesis protein FimT